MSTTELLLPRSQTPLVETEPLPTPNTQRIKLNLHPGQSKAWASDARFLLILAGTRSGKTSFGPWWLWREIQRRGAGDYLVTAPTFKLLERAAVPYLDDVFHVKLRLGKLVGGAYGHFRISPEGEIKLWGKKQPVQTRILFGHGENPDSLEAAQYKAAWLDEAGQKQFKQQSWEAVQRRLAIDQGRCLFSTTPYVLGWLKSEVHDRAIRYANAVRDGLEFNPVDADYELVSFESVMNPAFPLEEWDRARATLPKWKFDLFYRGRFTRPAGAVYDCWEPDHMTDPGGFIPPVEWKRYCGIDFGAPNFVALFIAEEPGAVEEVAGPMPKGKAGKLLVKHPSTLHVYAEYAPQEARSARQHVAAMRKLRKELEGENPVPLSACIGGSKSEEQWRLDFSAEGFAILPPDQPDVERGIDRVYARIRTDHLRVSARCPRLLADLIDYSRPVDEAGNVLEGLEDKEMYHAADGLRYIVSWLDRTGIDFFFRIL